MRLSRHRARRLFSHRRFLVSAGAVCLFAVLALLNAGWARPSAGVSAHAAHGATPLPAAEATLEMSSSLPGVAAPVLFTLAVLMLFEKVVGRTSVARKVREPLRQPAMTRRTMR